MPRDREDNFKRRHQAERAEQEKLEKLEKDDAEKVREILEKIEPLMEQVDGQYRMYMAGVERMPPTERRRLLDQSFFQLQNLSKPTMTLRFMADQARSRYVTMKERWDRQMKDLENGKIKRPNAKSG